MARRRDPGSREYSPLDDAKGRLPIEADLVRDVIGDRVAMPPADPPKTAAAASPVQEEQRPQLTVVPPVESAVSTSAATQADRCALSFVALVQAAIWWQPHPRVRQAD